MYHAYQLPMPLHMVRIRNLGIPSHPDDSGIQDFKRLREKGDPMPCLCFPLEVLSCPHVCECFSTTAIPAWVPCPSPATPRRCRSPCISIFLYCRRSSQWLSAHIIPRNTYSFSCCPPKGNTQPLVFHFFSFPEYVFGNAAP